MNKKLFAYNKSIDTNKHLLFCFHHAGGTGAAFRPWMRILEEKLLEVIPLELPGHGYRRQEKAITQYDELVVYLVEELREYLQGLSYSFYGHSMGAALAFSTEIKLEEYGLFAEKLILAGRFGASIHDPGTFRIAMGDKALIEEMRELSPKNAMIYDNLEFLEYFLPIIRVDYALHEQFTYHGEKTKVPIVAHCGNQDQNSLFKHMQHWKDSTESEFTIKEFEGNHFFPHDLKEEYLKEIANELMK